MESILLIFPLRRRKSRYFSCSLIIYALKQFFMSTCMAWGYVLRLKNRDVFPRFNCWLETCSYLCKIARNQIETFIYCSPTKNQTIIHKREVRNLYYTIYTIYYTNLFIFRSFEGLWNLAPLVCNWRTICYTQTEIL